MSKIAFCADVHLGNHRRFGGAIVAGLNERCLEGLIVLRSAIETAQAKGCAGFVVLGDLFDSDRPPPQLIRRVQNLLRTAPPMDVIMLVGNHDRRSDVRGDHALGPLADLATVCDTSTVVEVSGVRLLCCPFNSAAPTQWIPEVLEHETADVLCAHMGIISDETPVWLRESTGAIRQEKLRDLCTEHDIGAAFCGDWHNHGCWGKIVQAGALVPTGWDNSGADYGFLHVYDGERVERIRIPGPRFHTLGADETDWPWRREDITYLRLHSCAADMAQRLAFAEGLVQEGKAKHAVVLPANETRDQSRKAAAVARSQDTLHEAVEAYVQAMPLAEGVDRSCVLAETFRYLDG